MKVVMNEHRELAALLASRPGLLGRVMRNGVIDRQALRAELRREENLEDFAKHGGERPHRDSKKNGGPKLRQPSPSPWARDHPKWSEK